ncbi:MAG TPA: hypothetical protein IAB89_01630 [Candidatus Caccousia avicola]|uniref:Uncharacterized protein n=1 Tax=Candidatus Caccousia avicola TaxID=2840721 RepID=A0A9D1DEX9_9FIRM|nr:hypothetical protein [Candidatus Caccousia avicola]
MLLTPIGSKVREKKKRATPRTILPPLYAFSDVFSNSIVFQLLSKKTAPAEKKQFSTFYLYYYIGNTVLFQEFPPVSPTANAKRRRP